MDITGKRQTAFEEKPIKAKIVRREAFSKPDILLLLSLKPTI